MSSKKKLIRKAVFPIAGRGTRFLPSTKASPKEMLTVVNKPLIQYAVEEAYQSGIRQMIFVTRHNKKVIEDHFDLAYELEKELMALEQHEFLSLVRSVKPVDMECFYVRQPQPLGLGHAVLCAEHMVGQEDFAVILPDDLMEANVPVLKQMMDIYREHDANVLAIEEVPRTLVSQYGVVEGEAQGEHLLLIKGLVEKPQPEQAPSNNAIVGRYILSPAIFKHIAAIPKEKLKEIQLTDALSSLLKEEPVLAYRYDGRRFDCGSVLGFLKANVELGKTDPLIGQEFSNWLKDTNQ